MKSKIVLGALASVFALGLLGGCTPEARDQYDSAGESAQKTMDKTGDAIATDADKTGDAIAQGAENAAEAAADATADAAKAAENAGMTLKIKNAILTAEKLEAEDLNVETVKDTVVLKGSVPTAENKKRAEDIARTQVGTEWKVDNQLTVRPKG